MQTVIRPLAPTDSLGDLTDLLHRAYKALADLGLRYLATHQEVQTTRERVESGVCLVAEIDGRIVGTITYYPPGRTNGSAWLNSPDVGEIGQLAVDPGFQRRGIATRLVGAAERLGTEAGVSELALDTAEQADHLITWYERLGFRFIEHVDWDVTNYRSVVMSKTLRS
jgi:ribosomal protein S18 acetylase RimI-like enzyme